MALKAAFHTPLAQEVRQPFGPSFFLGFLLNAAEAFRCSCITRPLTQDVGKRNWDILFKMFHSEFPRKPSCAAETEKQSFPGAFQLPRRGVAMEEGEWERACDQLGGGVM